MAVSTTSAQTVHTDDHSLMQVVAGRGTPRDQAIEAFETLYRRHGHRSLGYLAARVPPEELDTAHAVVWQRIWSRTFRRRRGGSLDGLIHEVARDYVAEHDEGAPAAGLVEADRRDTLADCLGQLDEDQVELVRFRLGAEGYDSIGERSTVSASRVHKLYHRATAALLRRYRDSYDRLFVLDLPEKPSQLATWLEQHVAGLNLAVVVAELDAVHPSDGNAENSMERSLGSLLSEVLSSGLSVLGRDRLVWFLQNPTWLLELQERVLLGGGPYWARQAERTRDEAAETVDRHWASVRAFAVLDDGEAAIEPPSASTIDWATRLADRERWLRFLPHLATAAVTALVVFVATRGTTAPGDPATDPRGRSTGRSSTASPDDWGWNREDLFQASTDRDYLLALSEGANEWFAERPTTAAGLARRLGELRAGCSRVLLAEHDLLGREDREWLHENCRGWADAIDRQLVRLESAGDVEAVRSDVDRTVGSLSKALEARAAHQ